MSILNMKSSLATRKFDRIFSSRSLYNVEHFGEQTNKLTKEVRWKVDKSVRKRLELCRDRLEEQLRQLQSIGLAEYKLLLGDETLQELREHFLDQVELNTRQSNWREEEADESDLEKHCSPVVNQIERLRLMLSRPAEPVNSSSISHGIGGDEESVFSFNNMNGSLEFINSAFRFNQLDSDWQFWFWRSDQRYLKWDFGLQKLGKPIRSAKEMNDVLDQLIDIHEVAIPSDYSVFRADIKPKWEDLANKDGGSWIMEFERSTTDVSVIQAIWMRLLEFIFEPEEKKVHDHSTASAIVIDVASVRAHIRGLKISMRFKSYQISVWTGSFVDLENVFRVGIAMQRAIGPLVEKLPRHELFYRAHKVSQQNALIKEQTKFGFDHGLYI